jgi:hypothetical protein
VTTPGAEVAGLTDGARLALAELVSAHLQRSAPGAGPPSAPGSLPGAGPAVSEGDGGEAPIEVIGAEVLVRGRPGLVDVIARMGDRLIHLPLGLRKPGGETRFLAGDDDPVLGVFEDEDGLAVAFEALQDAEVVTALLRHVTGQEADPGWVRQIRRKVDSVTLAVEERLAFTVFSELVEGPRAGLTLLLALDDVGFNHMPPPSPCGARGDGIWASSRSTCPGDRRAGPWP